jgi:uncharacterized protein (DUF1778 family)
MKMAKKLHEMTEDERGDYYYEHRDDETFVLSPVPIKVRRGATVSTMFSLRIPAEELMEIGDAARVRGMSVSEFMRKASLAAAHDEKAADQAVAIGAAKAKARELAEALSKL